MLQTIPLNKLEISPENVRKTERDTDIDALAANIAAVGLRQNLNVKPGPKGRFLVTAGGRRLRALKALAKAKTIKASAPIPCIGLEDGEHAAEISLAENVHRVAMHPMDQFEAFTALIDGGKTVEDVARRFGCGVRLVNQRLKLGRLSPRIRDAFRDGEIDLERTAFNGGYQRVHPTTQELSAEDAAEIQRLEKRLYELEQEDETDIAMHEEWSLIDARLGSVDQ